jgi:hypothetical protein
VFEETTQGLLREASDLLGAEELATALKVPRSLLEAWIGGHASMPDRKLRLLTEILAEVATRK